jgi:hypothetical protein
MLIYDLLVQPHTILYVKFNVNYLFQNIHEIEEYVSFFIENLGYNKIYFLYDNYHVFNCTKNIEDTQFFECILRNANSSCFPLIISNYDDPEPYNRTENALTQNFGYEHLPLLPLVVGTKEVIYYGNVDYDVITRNNIKPAIYMLEGKVMQTVTESDPNYLDTIYSAPFLPKEQYIWDATTAQRLAIPIKYQNDDVSLLPNSTQPLRLTIDLFFRYLILFCNKPNALITIATSIDEVDGLVAASGQRQITLQPGASIIYFESTLNLNLPKPVSTQKNPFRHAVVQQDYIIDVGIKDIDAKEYNPYGEFDEIQTTRLLVIHNTSNVTLAISLASMCTEFTGSKSAVSLLQNSYGAFSLPRYSKDIPSEVHPSVDIQVQYDATALTNPTKMRGQFIEVKPGHYGCVFSNAFSTPLDFPIDDIQLIFSDLSTTDIKNNFKFALHGYSPNNSITGLSTKSTQPFSTNSGVIFTDLCKPGFYTTGSNEGTIGDTQGNGFYFTQFNPSYDPKSAYTLIQGCTAKSATLEKGEFIEYPWDLTTPSNTIWQGSGLNQSYFFWSLVYYELRFKGFSAAGFPKYAQFNGVTELPAQEITTVYEIKFNRNWRSSAKNEFYASRKNKSETFERYLFTYSGRDFLTLNNITKALSSYDYAPDYDIFSIEHLFIGSPKFVWMYSENEYYQNFRPDLTLNATDFTFTTRGVYEVGRFMPPLPDTISVLNFAEAIWPSMENRFYSDSYATNKFGVLLITFLYSINMSVDPNDTRKNHLNCFNCGSKSSYYFEPNAGAYAAGKWLNGRVVCSVCKRDFIKTHYDLFFIWDNIVKAIHDIIYDLIIDPPETQIRIQYSFHDPIGQVGAPQNMHVISPIKTYTITREQKQIEIPCNMLIDDRAAAVRALRANCRLMGYWVEYVIPFPTLIIPTLDVIDTNNIVLSSPTTIYTYNQVRGIQNWSPFYSDINDNNSGLELQIDVSKIMDFGYHQLFVNDLVYPLTDISLYYGLYSRIETERPTFIKYFSTSVDQYIYFRPQMYLTNTACYPRVENPDSSVHNTCFPIFEKKGYVILQLQNHNLFLTYEGSYKQDSYAYCHWLTLQKNLDFAICPQWYLHYLATDGPEGARIMSASNLYQKLGYAYNIETTRKIFDNLAIEIGVTWYRDTFKTESWVVLCRAPGNNATTDYWYGIPFADPTSISYIESLWLLYACIAPFYVKQDTVELTDKLIDSDLRLDVNTTRGRATSKYFTGQSFLRGKCGLLSYSRVKKTHLSVWNTNKWNNSEYSWVESDSNGGSYYYHGAPIGWTTYGEGLRCPTGIELDTCTLLKWGSSVTTAMESTITTWPGLFNATVLVFNNAGVNPVLLFIHTLTDWTNPNGAVVGSANQPCTLVVTISRTSPSQFTNMFSMVRFGRQMNIAEIGGKLYNELPVWWTTSVNNWGIADLTIKDPSLGITAVFFAQEALVGNSAIQAATQQERIARGHWVIDSAYEPQEFKSYEIADVRRTFQYSSNYWDKTVYINEGGTEIQMAYRYKDSDPGIHKVLVYDEKPLKQAIVPQPGTFSFHWHFDCEYRCEFFIIIPTFGVTNYVKTSSYPASSLKTFTYEVSLRQLGERIENKSFYMYANWKDRVNSHIEIITNCNLKNGQYQPSFYNSEVNTCVFKQPHLDRLSKIYIRVDTNSPQTTLNSIIIGVAKYAD